MVIAPLKQRREEIITGKFCFEHFVNATFAEKAVYKFSVADKAADMVAQVAGFSKDVKDHERPFVLFLGHGSAKNELAFYHDRKDSKEMLLEMKEAFNENCPSNRWPLRCVFTQCHGHLIDPRPSTPGAVHELEGVEYVYLSSTKSPLCWYLPRYDYRKFR